MLGPSLRMKKKMRVPPLGYNLRVWSFFQVIRVLVYSPGLKVLQIMGLSSHT